jgi:hypothetical protein
MHHNKLEGGHTIFENFTKVGEKNACQDGDGLAPNTALEQVYDISELDNIRAVSAIMCHT